MGGPGWLTAAQGLFVAVATMIHGMAAAASLDAVDVAAAVAAGALLPMAAEAATESVAEATLPAPGPPHDAVPILMYHVIAPGPNNLYVPPHELEAHLRTLSEHGFTTVSLQQLADHFTHGVPLPERPVVLTFDDGYVSVYTAALPLLQQYDMTATFFIVTGLVGQAGYMTWEQVAELAAAGMEIGAHTVLHQDLRWLDDAERRHEIAGSAQTLIDKLGVAVTAFAYPAGAYNDETVAIVREHFTAAVTTLPGAATPCQDPMLWHRIRINPGVSGPDLHDIIDYWDRQPACR